MTNYQKRMDKFVFWTKTYSLAGVLAIFYCAAYSKENLFPAIAILASTEIVLVCLAIGFDAVYDSLRELPEVDFIGEPAK